MLPQSHDPALHTSRKLILEKWVAHQAQTLPSLVPSPKKDLQETRTWRALEVCNFLVCCSPIRSFDAVVVAEFPKIADTKSKIVQLEGEQEYTYCRCGLSQNQPWCDGSHERENTGITPMCFTAEATEKRPLCMCKRSKGMPFCDGSHRSLDPVDIEDLLVDPTWVCVNGKTLPPVPEPPAEDAPAAAESAPVQVEAQPDQAEDKQ